MVEIYDPSQHDYDRNPPSFVEVEEGHFVLANEEETARYREKISLGVS